MACGCSKNSSREETSNLTSFRGKAFLQHYSHQPRSGIANEMPLHCGKEQPHLLNWQRLPIPWRLHGQGSAVRQELVAGLRVR